MDNKKPKKKKAAPLKPQSSLKNKLAAHPSLKPQYQATYTPDLDVIAAPHLESFNFFLNPGLDLAVAQLNRMDAVCLTRPFLYRFTFSKVYVKPPVWEQKFKTNVNKVDSRSDKPLYPNQCREGHITYGAQLIGTFHVEEWSLSKAEHEILVKRMRTTRDYRMEQGANEERWKRKDDEQPSEAEEESEEDMEALKTLNDPSVPRKITSYSEDVYLGKLPIMVRSKICRLAQLKPDEMVKRKEEPYEPGGYFIVNGNERLIRMLISQRRHDPIAQSKKAWQKMGAAYSEHGVSIRCVTDDQHTVSNILHYMKDGTISLRFFIKSTTIIISVLTILRALVDTTDREIFEKIVQGDFENTFLVDSAEVIIRNMKQNPLNKYTKEANVMILGRYFKNALSQDLPLSYLYEDVGNLVLDKYVLPHLDSNRSKFDMMIFMVRKLLALVKGDIGPDSTDTVMNQELLLPGHIYLTITQDRLQSLLSTTRTLVVKALIQEANGQKKVSNTEITEVMRKVGPSISHRLASFLATGNVVLTNLATSLPQLSGFTITAEKINYLRWISHFRSVHRGAFFMDSKISSIRKLLPESWGFMCPVHTPDGAPCGLLTHIASTCKIVSDYLDPIARARFENTLRSVGVFPRDEPSSKDDLSILLDGKVVGFATVEELIRVEKSLRHWKAKGENKELDTLEICLVLPATGGRYPGLFLFKGLSRMMRPVRYLPLGTTENIGTFEQVYLHIAVDKGDIAAGITRHQELSPTNILDIAAKLTPFSDFNQSPRNMYQCQMAKQTMGTPVHSFPYRSDNKMYRIQTPQEPIVRTEAQAGHGVTDYPSGTNAIVAVISYTGYDMEDAMIINKSSYERGFAHGSVYKTEIVELKSKPGVIDGPSQYFSNALNDDPPNFEGLDRDGLPFIGDHIEMGSLLYSTYDKDTKSFAEHKYKGREDGYIDGIRIIDSENGMITKISIKIRLNRNPVIGDKFSSRHGQKGVLSQLWPQVNMPFSESGMTPDIIINPHAFPSRMTIGMLVESMAAKSGALHGMFQDATPFQFDEKDTAVNFFGEQLLKAGYNYYGNEPMYSGTTGTEFAADIYFGVVYYQRLRHMVKDKYQARAHLGPIDALTRQPMKGRKRGGGIRFGEMERDSLIAHGGAFLLQDRLLHCSDVYKTLVCTACGSLFSPLFKKTAGTSDMNCKSCSTAKYLKIITVPYVFKLFAAELAAMNVKLTLDISDKTTTA